MSHEQYKTWAGLPMDYIERMANHAGMPAHRFLQIFSTTYRRRHPGGAAIIKEDRALVRMTLQEFGLRRPPAGEGPDGSPRHDGTADVEGQAGYGERDF